MDPVASNHAKRFLTQDAEPESLKDQPQASFYPVTHPGGINS
jgi:hypothetical protein